MTVPLRPAQTPPPVADAMVPAQSSSPVAPALQHPTSCPSWCRHRGEPASHSFGPTSTNHFSPQYRLLNPSPAAAGNEVLLKAELYRYDGGSETGLTTLYVQGETDAELTAPEVDVLIAQHVAFVETLRVLRRQMS